MAGRERLCGQIGWIICLILARKTRRLHCEKSARIFRICFSLGLFVREFYRLEFGKHRPDENARFNPQEQPVGVI